MNATMTHSTERCKRCGWIIRVRLDANGKPDRVLCPVCQAAADDVRGLGALKEYPILSVEDLPRGALCTWCQQKNGPERAEAMYVHDDGTPGARWYGHVSCEVQREYDKYEEWRDTQDGEGD